MAVLAIAGIDAWRPALAQPASPLTEQRYDIPAQPIRLALARFSQISRVDIIYDDSLASGRTSAPVSGTLTPQQALAALLAGTDLSFRFTRSNAALIYTVQPGPSLGNRPDMAEPVLTLDTMHVRASPVVGTRTSYNDYGQHILRAIDERLRPDAVANGRNYRVVMQLWIAEDGAIRQAELARGTGDGDLDSRMIGEVSTIRLDPPPARLPQPVRLQLEAR